MTASETASRPEGVAYETLPGFSRLFTDYLEYAEPLRRYFAGDFRSVNDLRDVAGRVAARKRDRESLVDALLDQNRRWDLDEAARANIERLGDPESVAVVTGQQLGLLGGPLYTVLKTLTAVGLARWLEGELGRPVVPVFWLEGEDHDFEEIAWVSVAGRGEAARVTYSRQIPDGHTNHGPVGRMRVDESMSMVFEQLASILPENEYRDDILSRLRAIYAPGQTMRSAFARTLQSMFAGSGLVLASPDDPALKRLLRPVFRREAGECGKMQAVIEKATVDLAETYHAQIRPRALNLFTLTDGGRLALDASDDCDSVSIRGADRDLSMTELQQRIESSPESFSPSVALRPIAQDTLLPTAVYVAGPSEIAYFAQLKPAYDLAQIPMPIIYPRASVTVLPSRTAGQLADAGLAIGDLARPLDELFAELVEASMEVDLSESFAFEVAAIDEIVNRLKGIAEAVEVTLGKSAEATRAAVHKEIDRFKGRVLKAEKNKHEVLRGRLERLRAQVFPLDGLQERKLSAVHYLCRYGPGFLERLREEVDLDTRNHQIVVLD